ncbi:unnamed protein product [Rotaria sp. Silwood2]|nr:unnamed protein product [Rotaria sp. Silwood2]
MNKNRFFADGNSSSSEESSDNEQQIKVQTKKSFAKSYFITNDSNEENVKRIVRSEKDKRYDEIEEYIKKIKQVIRIRDLNQVYECFGNLIKAYDKARRVIEKEQTIPRFYIKILAQLEDFLSECWNNRDECKQFNKKNSNNLKKLRQKFHQYVQIESLQNEINLYREKPNDDQLVEINVTSSNDEDQQNNDSESDSSDEFSNRSNDNSIDNELLIEKKETDMYVYFQRRKTDSQNKTTTKRRAEERKHIQRTNVESLEEPKFTEEIPKLEKFDNDEEISYEDILKKLNEILSIRGKRSTNYHDQLEYLNHLRQYVKKRNLTVEIDIKILLIQIIISFDYHQKENNYLNILDYTDELVTLISDNDHIDISEYLKEESILYNLHDDVITIILKINDEFTKLLRNIDHHSQNYIERLKDEFRICSIINRLKIYFELKSHDNNKIIQSEHLCKIYLCFIEHIYYKYDKTFDQSSIVLMNHLCKYIYTNEKLNHVHTQANLYHIYHSSLHDHYNEARNLMLMSHIQETIHFSNISTQILYNRTMVQLGLCAFRFGEVHEAHQILMNLQPGNRMKELLGQNIHIMNTSEIKEQQHLLPYHMHINLQLIECIYLISAMLIEIPSIRKQSISKHYRIVMCQGEKQLTFESMETMREHILAASHALKVADWNTCVNYLINDKMNKQIWNLMPQGIKIFEMLINKIKEESLRIYLFTNATIFDSISIPSLADIFELSIKQVYEIICKMIINEELMASIEDLNQIVILNQNRSSQIQILSAELMEKIFQLYEQNQKLNHFYSRSSRQLLK